MVTPLQKHTDKKCGNFNKKTKDHIDAVYNMSEMVRVVQAYYKLSYPDSPPIPRDRIRAMLYFFLDTIIHSVDTAGKTTLTGFGTFKKQYISEAYYPDGVHRQACYRPPFYRIGFKASGRVKDILNHRNPDAFNENYNIIDELYDYDHSPKIVDNDTPLAATKDE
jgi:nucleoid DNA-binding protein